MGPLVTENIEREWEWKWGVGRQRGIVGSG